MGWVNIASRPVKYYWRDDAICDGMDTNLFFPETGGRAAAAIFRRAKKICFSCPVKEPCLATAMKAEAEDSQHRVRYGVFGGLSPSDRDELADIIEGVA